MSGVTLDGLLKEVGVTPSQLDKPCSREHLQDVALFLESWRTVAPHLGLSRTEMEEIERDGREEREKRLKILELWKGKFAFKATYKVLIEVCLKISRADQAEKVCRLLVSQHSKEGTQPSLIPRLSHAQTKIERKGRAWDILSREEHLIACGRSKPQVMHEYTIKDLIRLTRVPTTGGRFQLLA